MTTTAWRFSGTEGADEAVLKLEDRLRAAAGGSADADRPQAPGTSWSGTRPRISSSDCDSLLVLR